MLFCGMRFLESRFKNNRFVANVVFRLELIMFTESYCPNGCWKPISWKTGRHVVCNLFLHNPESENLQLTIECRNLWWKKVRISIMEMYLNDEFYFWKYIYSPEMFQPPVKLLLYSLNSPKFLNCTRGQVHLLWFER